MKEVASAENRVFENAEALAHEVAQWLCGPRAGERTGLCSQPVGRLDASGVFMNASLRGNCVALSMEPRTLVLGRRKVRAARPSRQQLSDGARTPFLSRVSRSR